MKLCNSIYKICVVFLMILMFAACGREDNSVIADNSADNISDNLTASADLVSGNSSEFDKQTEDIISINENLSDNLALSENESASENESVTDNESVSENESASENNVDEIDDLKEENKLFGNIISENSISNNNVLEDAVSEKEDKTVSDAQVEADSQSDSADLTDSNAQTYNKEIDFDKAIAYIVECQLSKDGLREENGSTYYYDANGIMHTGWMLIDGQLYFFDRITGERIVGMVIDGITIQADGVVEADNIAFLRISTMMKAHKILEENTDPTDTMETKRDKVFNWILSFPYYRHRHLKNVYNDVGIETVFANDMFDSKKGDCVSESAALAFLFHEIGYDEVYWCHDTGHSWVDMNGKLFDPLFAEAREFEANYNADYTDYRSNPPHKMKIY